MPPRAAATPRRPPPRLVGRARLPQDEVGGVALVRRDLDPRAGDHLVERPPRQATVVAGRGDVEQDVTLGGVGDALGDERADHRDHRRDVIGRVRREVGRLDPERAHVGEVLRLGAVGDDLRLDPLGGGGGDDLVVDVGDVARINDVVGAVLVAQQPLQHVEHHRRPGVADVRAAVNRRPADVHRHSRGVGGDEVDLRPAHRVVQAQRHYSGVLPPASSSLSSSLRSPSE